MEVRRKVRMMSIVGPIQIASINKYVRFLWTTNKVVPVYPLCHVYVHYHHYILTVPWQRRKCKFFQSQIKLPN